MSARRLMRRLSYFTIEDESMLAEAFAGLEDDVFAVTYKVNGSEDVFVTTAETREAMDRSDVSYNLLAEEDPSMIVLHHTPLSREELAEYEDAVKALTLASGSVAAACVGVNGDKDLGLNVGDGGGIRRFSYFTVPAGHTFIFRLFRDRQEAIDFLAEFAADDFEAQEWAHGIPLASADELTSYH
ncbi:MAG: hypothetical protein ACRD2Z_05030 [Thermoanaerobaculia bacterium]